MTRKRFFLNSIIIKGLALTWLITSFGCQAFLGPKNLPENMIYIPSGDFIMGSALNEDGTRDFEVGVDEIPEHKRYLREFYIDKFETTIGEYLVFLEKTGTPPPQLWFDPIFQRGNLQHDYPVVDVSWYEADAYCRFVGKRLPTEAVWEKAARGTDARIYPWGNEFNDKWCNTMKRNEKMELYSVGSNPKNRSPYGVMDMCGNAMEWTSSWYRGYPGSTLKRETFGEKYKVLKGGAWDHLNLGFSRIPHRHFVAPQWDHPGYGIRCVKDQ